MDRDYEEFAERTKIDNDNIKALRKELKKRKKTLVNENNVINEECKHLKERKKAISLEHEELKETIETLKEELEQLDENLLRVNLKIN